MSHPPGRHPAEIYCRLMGAIKMRLAHLDKVRVLDNPTQLPRGSLYEVEAALLCLRKILELLAFSSLVANAEELRSVVENVGRMWRAQKILEQIEKVNPDFFPRPGLMQFIPSGVDHFAKAIGFIPLADPTQVFHRGEFVALYDACGMYIHAHNPLAKFEKPDLKYPLPEWLARIRGLLEVHLVHLAGGEAGVVDMKGWGEESPVFNHVGPLEKPTPNWGTRG